MHLDNYRIEQNGVIVMATNKVNGHQPCCDWRSRQGSNVIQTVRGLCAKTGSCDAVNVPGLYGKVDPGILDSSSRSVMVKRYWDSYRIHISDGQRDRRHGNVIHFCAGAVDYLLGLCWHQRFVTERSR